MNIEKADMASLIRTFMLLVATALVLTGCAFTVENPDEHHQNDADVTINRYMAQAAVHEQRNELIDAKNLYHLVLSSRPGHPDAEKALQTLNKRLEKLAEQHYEQSRLLLKEGKYERSEQHLKQAVIFWPDHDKAQKALSAQALPRFFESVTHTVEKGETLSLIAMDYYGTMRYAPVIARVNQIKDAAKIKIGMVLKIPKLPHVPFHDSKKVSSKQHKGEPTIEPDIPIVGPAEMHRAVGIKFYESADYLNAAAQFKQALQTDPKNRDLIDKLTDAYLRLGDAADANHDYAMSMRYYQNALQADPGCRSCRVKWSLSQKAYKESHYKAGMEFFDAQKLSQAIEEWEKVYTLDPDYKSIFELLQKAGTIQRNVNTIREEQ